VRIDGGNRSVGPLKAPNVRRAELVRLRQKRGRAPLLDLLPVVLGLIKAGHDEPAVAYSRGVAVGVTSWVMGVDQLESKRSRFAPPVTAEGSNDAGLRLEKLLLPRMGAEGFENLFLSYEFLGLKCLQ
jgi:hypothetical protein